MAVAWGLGGRLALRRQGPAVSKAASTAARRAWVCSAQADGAVRSRWRQAVFGDGAPAGGVDLDDIGADSVGDHHVRAGQLGRETE